MLNFNHEMFQNPSPSITLLYFSPCPPLPSTSLHIFTCLLSLALIDVDALRVEFPEQTLNEHLQAK